MIDFNPEGKCPKCEHKELKTFYCVGSQFSWRCGLETEGEHLHRKCQRCHYEWLEKCTNRLGRKRKQL